MKWVGVLTLVAGSWVVDSEKRRRIKMVGEGWLNIGRRRKINEIQNCGHQSGCVMFVLFRLGVWVNRQELAMNNRKHKIACDFWGRGEGYDEDHGRRPRKEVTLTIS